MKYKHIIKSAFEQEERKEATHIKALEKQLLSKIQEEKDLDQEMRTYFPRRNSFWTSKLPYAFAVLLLFVLFFGISTRNPAMAKGNIIEALVNLKNQLQQELTNLLFHDPNYRDKGTQKYKQTRQEWCSVSARSPEEQEKAVAAIRDFLDRPDAHVNYECVIANPNKPDEKPQTETYKVDFDRFFIDTRTNLIREMSLIEDNNWGVNKDGSRWFSQRKQYDYAPNYDQAGAEQLALDFIRNHEKSVGKVDLQPLVLETYTKDRDDNKIEYNFTWKGKTEEDFTPQLTITFTQAGQLIHFLNHLSR